MSRLPDDSAAALGNRAHDDTGQSMIRLVCFLQPGEYSQRFERHLARQDVVVLRARHELHAYWTILTTEPQALVTDIPVTKLANDYLLGRLQQNPKTRGLPVLVLGTTGSSTGSDLDLHDNVHLLEVTTPTRMADHVLEHVRRLLANSHERPRRRWRADQPTGNMIAPRRRTHVASSSPAVTLIVPRRVQDRDAASPDHV